MGFSRWFGGWGWLYSAPLEVRGAETWVLPPRFDALNGFIREFLLLPSGLLFANVSVQALAAKSRVRF
jgi:hypothetical protein